VRIGEGNVRKGASSEVGCWERVSVEVGNAQIIYIRQGVDGFISLINWTFHGSAPKGLMW